VRQQSVSDTSGCVSGPAGIGKYVCGEHLDFRRPRFQSLPSPWLGESETSESDSPVL